MPKGVLLMGPPGTGKTLLGRAVAGEAGVPFFSINGSEFIQMFVGVGASRVRDLFDTAKENAPAILFIDEIDAVGRHRGAGLGGGHDEREQTLNQILSEMDGFTPDRVGDRHGRHQPARRARSGPAAARPLRPPHHRRSAQLQGPRWRSSRSTRRDVPLADDVDLERLAAGTVGLTGADIRNLVNEAALWASRHDKDRVDMADFEYARDKVLMGSKREEVLIGKEKSMTAYHEAGHALLAWLVPGIDRVHKVSIIPRGRSLGATQLLPEEDRVNISESELHTRLLFLLGGRAAEKLVFDEYSAGAEDDLKQGHATRPADGHPLGHERAARAGRLPRQRGPSVPGQGDGRAAPVQRAHGPGDRRGGRRASCARPPTQADADAHRAPRQARHSWPRRWNAKKRSTNGDIEELIGPSAGKKLEAEKGGDAPQSGDRQ